MTERNTRRTFLGRGARLAAGAATLSFLRTEPFMGVGVGPAVASAHNVASSADRAVELYNAMQRYFYTDNSLYLETSPRKNSKPYAYLWPFYEAMAGTIDLSGVPQIGPGYVNAVKDRRAGLARYYRGTANGYDSYVRPPLGPGGDRYYDDNSWVGRALAQLYRMTNDATALDGAKDVFQFVQTGWYENPNDPTSGGMFWVQEGAAAGWNRDRGTGPTGGAAKLALNLYELTGQASYRDWGKRAYDWVNANLLTKTGEFAGKLYWDKIRGDGSLDTAYWSYNQGVMIGAGVLLHRITGDPAYLDQAVRTADAALDYYGNRVGWYSQPVIFNVLFFRNLLMLYALNGNLTYLNAVQGFADKVWNDPKVHNQQKHLIKFEEWTSAYKLREQAAMVQIYAGLAWDPSRSNRSVYSKLA